MSSQEKSKSNITKIEQSELQIIDDEIGNLEFRLTDFPPSTSKEIKDIKDDIKDKINTKEKLQAKINNRTIRGFHVKTESSGKHRKRKITKKKKHKKRKTKKRKPKNKRKTKKR